VIRKTVAEIDLDRLAANFRKIRETVGGRQIIAVVKADAYGHGAVPVARRLENEGAGAFGVACVSEAVELREAGIESPIMVFFETDRLEEIFTHDLIPVVFDDSMVAPLAREAERRGRPIDVHVKVDTGMGRVGFPPAGCMEKILEIAGMKYLNVAGIMSHFSDADLRDRGFAAEQLSVFREIVKGLREKGMAVTAHIANSAGIMSFEESYLDAVRPGLMMYGYSPFCDNTMGLQPVMSLRTRIISVRRVPAGTPISYGRTFVTGRPSVIGVISVGYADGYSRLFSNRGEVLVRGRRAPVVGRVCMDLAMIDVTEVGDVSPGDEVVILSSDTVSGLTALDLAERVSTIPYEVLTSLGSRAARIYREQGREA